MEIHIFTGGFLSTNAYLLRSNDGAVLIDAPQGSAGWLAEVGIKLDALLLTHGHFDHVWDAARIQRDHGCKVGVHSDSLPLISDNDIYRRAGMAVEIEPLVPEWLLEEGAVDYLGAACEQLLVPGHCPGSICFYFPSEQALFGGDVLMAGGVGRWDLPGGDYELLMRGLKEKIAPLPDEVKVYSGHGPVTTIGHERTSNQWFSTVG